MVTAKFSKDQKYLAAGDSAGKIYVYKITAPATFNVVTSASQVTSIGTIS